MKTNEAIELFGGRRELAQALGVSVQATYQWGDVVPELRVYQLRDIISEKKT